MRISKVKLSAAALKYLAENEPRWSADWSYTTKRLLCRFHLWLRANHIRLETLSARQALDFMRDGIKENATSNHRFIIIFRSYLAWLKENNKTKLPLESVFPEYCDRWDRSLPPIAVRYFEMKTRLLKHPMSRTRTRLVLNRFHLWIEKHGVELHAVNRSHLSRFLHEYFKSHSYRPKSLHSFRSDLRLYLDWLVDHGYLRDLDLSGLFPKGRDRSYRKLTPCAREFLALLPTTKKPKTCSRYKTSLCNFYSFLSSKGIRERRIDRRIIELWLSHLKTSGLLPVSAQHFIFDVRSYFYWLRDRRVLAHDPADLIRVTDIPRRPKYLPRPLPPDVDREIQARLEKSDDVYHQGLLLMRLTGIRIGELWAMPIDCTRQDHNGNWSLKVPLGKLDNERLVPVDTKTLLLIGKLQQRARTILKRNGKPAAGAPLLVRENGECAWNHRIRIALTQISKDIDLPERITPHRLRHTFATELLNGGMSLFGVMRLLGHRNVTTTLIYASVAQDTIREEYFIALGKMKSKYTLPTSNRAPDATTEDPLEGFSDLIKWLKKSIETSNPTATRQRSLLLKRLHRLEAEVRQLARPE